MRTTLLPTVCVLRRAGDAYGELTLSACVPARTSCKRLAGQVSGTGA